MTHSHAGLLLDMGLGKTVVTLTVLHRLLYDEFALNKALVIAPKRVAEDTWSREAEKWDHLADLRVVKVLGTAKQREAALRQDGDVYVINRENVVWLVETLGSHWPFDGIVIDELSSFKSSRSKRWRALRRVVGCANYVYGLTGTPATISRRRQYILVLQIGQHCTQNHAPGNQHIHRCRPFSRSNRTSGFALR